MELVPVAAPFLLYTLLTSLALLGLEVGLTSLLLRTSTGGRVLAPRWRLIIAGICLMVLGPTVLWSIRRSILPPLAAGSGAAAPMILDAPTVATSLGLSAGAAGLFLIGGLLAGAGLRPRARPRLGILCALGLYVACGLVWLLVFVDDGVTPEKIVGILSPIAWPLVLVQILFWPSLVAQRLGLFG